MTVVRVASDELVHAAGALHRAAVELAEVAALLASAQSMLREAPRAAFAVDVLDALEVPGPGATLGLLGAAGAWGAASEAVQRLPDASSVVAPLAGSAELLARLLVGGAFGYEHTEQVVSALVRGDLDARAYEAGRGAVLALATGQPFAAAGRLGTVLAPLLPLLASPDYASSADGAFAVRTVMTQLDDLALGAAGEPHASAYAPDRLGTDLTALAALALAGMGGAATAGVSVERVSARAAVAPASLRDLGTRIPSAVPGAPQVRIERYGTPSRRSWIVYATGTVEFTTRGRTVFDLRADVAALADETAASTAATLDAMTDAGVGPGDPVLLVGHSQGGLVAQQVAETGRYDVRGLVLFGAPAAPHLGDVPVVAVEHREDVVPALVGFQPTHDGEAYAQFVVDGLDGSMPVPDQALPAHHMRLYEWSADAVERTGHPVSRRVLDQLATMAPPHTTGDAAWYLADRRVGRRTGPAAVSAADAG